MVGTAHYRGTTMQAASSFRFLVLGTITGLALLTLDCSKKPAAPPKLDVLVAVVQQADVPIYAELTGQLDGALNVEVRAKVDGFLKTMPIQQGQLVKKGELLFTIDARAPEAAVEQAKGSLAQAKAALDKAKADVARLKPLIKVGAVSQQDIDNAAAAEKAAQANFDATKGTLAAANVNLGYTRVTAPMDGLVGNTSLSPGALINANTLLTTISQTDRMKIEVAIPERAYIRMAEKINALTEKKVKDPAKTANLELILADGSVYGIKGWVETIDRAIDPLTGTLKVRALFPNPKGLLRPGQFGKIRSVSEQRENATLIPLRALVETQGAFSVAVVGADNKVEMRRVKPGPRLKVWCVLEDGVKPGEKVIVEGVQKVRPGQEVTPKAAPVEPLPGLAPTVEPAKAGA